VEIDCLCRERGDCGIRYLSCSVGRKGLAYRVRLGYGVRRGREVGIRIGGARSWSVAISIRMD
jgi:hypothetical protein